MERIRLIGMLAGFLLVAAACEPPSGEILPTQPEFAVAEEAAMSEEIREAMGPECTFLKCTLCPVTAPECHQQCIWTGKCETRCEVVEICSDGYRWNEAACRCVPDKP
jgi:hypothetical protein